jgi:hypothetical protein
MPIDVVGNMRACGLNTINQYALGCKFFYVLRATRLMRARYYKSIQLHGDVSWLNANSPHCGEIYSILCVVQQGRRVDLVSWKKRQKSI